MATKSKGRSRKESPDGNELLVLELQEIHNAESQLTRALPKLAKTVESDKFRQMLEVRQEQGERLIQDIESALDEMDESPGRKRNVAAEGLINDAREHTQEIAAGPALDTVLIGAIQKTEHYCIAAWGTAKALGAATGQKSVVRAMDRALKEGKTLDQQLTDLAEREVTPALLAAADEDQEDDSRPRSRSRSSRGESRAS